MQFKILSATGVIIKSKQAYHLSVSATMQVDSEMGSSSTEFWNKDRKC